MTNLWFLGTVYFQREDRIFSAKGLYIFNIWGPYIFADRIFSAKWPYIFSDRTVYFQRLRTVYFRRPYILSRGPYIFSSRTVYFQPSGPYIFSLDRIFYVWPLSRRLRSYPLPSCILLQCLIMVLDSMNFALHTVHSNWKRSSCDRICTIQSPLDLYRFRHSLQPKGFSSVWILQCFSKFFACEVLWLHSEQLK